MFPSSGEEVGEASTIWANQKKLFLFLATFFTAGCKQIQFPKVLIFFFFWEHLTLQSQEEAK
jgi:hypothetical protein